MRTTSFGQDRQLTFVDRLGVWLSLRKIRHSVGDLARRRVADFGCGFEARFATSVVDRVEQMVLVDVSIAPLARAHPKVRAIEGSLPDAISGLEGASLDVVVCISVLEHLQNPTLMLSEIERVLVPGGLAVLNVPTWFGKRLLEFAAFRLRLAPAEEMDDHKTYYDPRDLWPLLVAAGFLPHNISCRRHKFGMNTFAVCEKSAPAGSLGTNGATRSVGK